MKHLICDLDGTLVACGRYYQAAEEDVAEGLAQQFGIDKALTRELAAFLDVWAIRVSKEGFKKERFPKSLAATAAAVQMICHPEGWIYPSVMQWALARGEEVFNFEKSPYTPFPGALETLQQYKDAGWKVYICTKGDPEVQNGKLALHGIDKMVDGVQVVPRKDPDTLRHVCTVLGINPETAVYVGDSVRDDMKPAKALGMRAIRVGAMAADRWLYDTTEDTVSDAVIETFADLPKVVPL